MIAMDLFDEFHQLLKKWIIHVTTIVQSKDELTNTRNLVQLEGNGKNEKQCAEHIELENSSED